MIRAPLLLAAMLMALVASPAVARPLTVAVAPSALAAQAPDGRWTGPAVDVMREAADASGRAIRFVPAPARSDALFPAAPGSRARQSAALFTDQLAVAGTPGGAGLIATVRRMATLQFLWIVLGLAVLLLAVGAAVWAFERRANEDFEGEEGAAGGVGQGFWWAGVTMTTIGYGDLVPKSLGGRTVAMLWMLLSMMLTAALTAYVVNASQQTGGSADLGGLVEGRRVGVVRGSAAALAVEGVGGRPVAFASVEAALDALDADELDRVAGGADELKAAGERSARATPVQLPLAVAARQGGEDFVDALNARVAQPSWWAQVQAARPD